MGEISEGMVQGGQAMSAQIHEAIKAAKEEGLFQGRILQGIEDIKLSMKKMEDNTTAQNVKIDTKADKETMNKIESDVRHLQRLVYIGMGILGTIEFLIVMLK